MHAQLTVASDAACENVASEMTSEVQPSLLQVDQKPGRQSLAHVGQSRKKIIDLSLPDVFLYDHLPKAGGSFVRGLFEKPENVGKVIPKESYRLADEATALTADMRRETFTVGSVRNPCEYYVSNWAFFGKLDGKIEKEQVYGVSENLDTPEDQLRFKKWLTWLMPEAKPPGLLTSRILWSYFNESVAGAHRHPEKSPLEPFTEADRAIYAAAADKLEPSTVDCWIKTENVASDLRKCLALFEDQAGKKIVNWLEFDKIIEQHEKQHNDPAQRMEVWTKNSGHKKCNFYFDSDLKDYVYKLDYAIFNKFGYPRCCSSDEV